MACHFTADRTCEASWRSRPSLLPEIYIMFLLPVLQRLLRHPSARRRQRSRRLAAALYLERLEDRSLLNAATFSGTPFTVGSTMSPASTISEQEETIVVSPVDSKTLEPTIIDPS